MYVSKETLTKSALYFRKLSRFAAYVESRGVSKAAMKLVDMFEATLSIDMAAKQAGIEDCYNFESYSKAREIWGFILREASFQNFCVKLKWPCQGQKLSVLEILQSECSDHPDDLLLQVALQCAQQASTRSLHPAELDVFRTALQASCGVQARF
jgi:hypothetical protein